MDISTPDKYGCLIPGHIEVVVRIGDCYAEVKIALGEDGQYRYSVSLAYSYGGFGGPIKADSPGFADVQAARTAGIEELLRCWPTPSPSNPLSVHDELRRMREQIASQLRQPSLF